MAYQCYQSVLFDSSSKDWGDGRHLHLAFDHLTKTLSRGFSPELLPVPVDRNERRKVITNCKEKSDLHSLLYLLTYTHNGVVEGKIDYHPRSDGARHPCWE
jgi:hypothetical protein